MIWPFCPTLTKRDIENAAHAYASAAPFKHVVLDGWFRDSVLTEVCRRFEHPDGWQQYEDGKQATSDVKDSKFFSAMNEAGVEIVERVTGRALEIDPTMRGGGLHRVQSGGRLGIHVDFNRHPSLPLERSINTILYLNEIWEPSWNGALTLTNRAMTHSHSVLPVWNRWVIFEYGPESWHGHPEPLACPPEIERRSAAVYYYRPLTEDKPFTGTQYA